MNISGLRAAHAPSTTSRADGATKACAEGTGKCDEDSTKLSKPAELFAKLEQLANADPAKAKHLFGKIAERLKGEAANGGDDRLAALAGKFGEAAKTGDVSGLGSPSDKPVPGPSPDGSVLGGARHKHVNAYAAANERHKRDDLFASVTADVEAALAGVKTTAAT